MNKNNQIWTGIIIIVLIVAGLWIWFRTSVASSSEIAANKKNIKPVDQTILTNASAQKILQMGVNGTVPVEVKSSDIGRDNPFSNY